MEDSRKNQTIWVLDPAHSELTFKVKHLMISNVKGEFKNFTVELDNEDLKKASLKVTVESASVFTNSPDRDNHLRSADFFDVENHPIMTFESAGLTEADDNVFTLKGVLTIKGISKEVVLNVEYGGTNKDPWGNVKAGFSFNGKIHRKNWGLNWNAALETGGVLVSDDVSINGEVQFVKQA